MPGDFLVDHRPRGQPLPVSGAGSGFILRVGRQKETSMWDGDGVRYELARAYRVLFTTTRHSRPGSLRSHWPADVVYDAEEIEEMRRTAVTEMRRKREWVHWTPRDIGRADIVLLGRGDRKGWLVEHLGGANDRPLKVTLARACIWEASGIPFKVGCRRLDWAYSTARRRVALGAEMLADALNGAGVDLAF
jgi:hypothetical protein